MDERIQEYVQAFQRFFEWEREKSPGCKIPNIVVRQGKRPREDKWYLGRLSSYDDVSRDDWDRHWEIRR